MERILILGAKGMLGQEFVKQLRGRDVVGFAREDIDITNEQEVMEKVCTLKPSVIFNCAAYNNVDRAEDEPEIANAINGEAVGYLAKAAVSCGATFVHFSTDYVFSGNRNDGYHEEDIPDPISKYGESKALGEQRLLAVFSHSERSEESRDSSIAALSRNDGVGRWYIVRTSKLFGPAGSGATSKKSFPEMMIEFARAKGRIEAIDGEVGSPTHVKDLAEAVIKMIDNGVVSGIYHITNSGSCTWYEYAKAAVEFSGVQAEVISVGSEHFPRKAKRPARVVLLNTKFLPLRPWQEALKDFLAPG